MDNFTYEENNEYITEQEARSVFRMFKENLKSYKEKDDSVTDEEWLTGLFRREFPQMRQEEAEADAKEITESIAEFDKNYVSVNEAAANGVSKENWLADKLEESSVGVSAQEFGQELDKLDRILIEKNDELAQAVRTKSMSVSKNKNLDGFIAENVLAKTTEMSATALGKNVKVEVVNSHELNSVDLCARNLDTGETRNYQVKFGKDAKATIDMLKNRDYTGQDIIVPKEQVEEVRKYFREQGSKQIITDHISFGGAEGKSYTKEELKQIQEAVQEEGLNPELNYDDYRTRDLAIDIGKNSAVMALQSAVITTGVNIATKVAKGEDIEADEVVETAIKTGVDTSLKTVTAGTLQVAVRKGIIRFIPKGTPAGTIANIACVGVENAKIMVKIATGELSLTKGIDQMGRVTTTMVAGLWGAAKGAAIGAAIGLSIPVIGAPVAVATGLVGGMVGYFAGSKVGDAVYNGARKAAGAAKSMAKSAYKNLKSTGRSIKEGIKNVFGRRLAY